MPANVIMPALGMAQETGKVVRWLKQDGDSVAPGEALLEVETDKVTVEIEAPAGGTLADVRAPEGTEVPVGTVIALVLADGEEVPVADPEPRLVREVEAVAAAPVASITTRRQLASPKARRLAAARGIDLAALENLILLQQARIKLGQAGARAVTFRNGRLAVTPIELDSTKATLLPGARRRRLPSEQLARRSAHKAGERERDAHRPAREDLRRGASSSFACERVLE